MNGPIVGDKIGKEIADGLGLKHVRRLDIHIACHEVVTVTAEFYLEIDGVKQLVPILKRYELVEKKETKEAT